MSAYKDINLTFDVVNEAVHCRVWGDWDKDSYTQNRTPEPLDGIVPYVRDALVWAHEANPDARLLINDYRVIVKGRLRGHHKALIRSVVALRDRRRVRTIPVRPTLAANCRAASS